MTSLNLQNQSQSFIQDAIFGGMAATFSNIFDLPISKFDAIIAYQRDSPFPVYFRAYRQSFSHFLREEGFFGLWPNFLASTLKSSRAFALNFGFYGLFKRVLSHDDKKSEFWKPLFAGGAAGATSLAIVYPIDCSKWKVFSGLAEQKSRNELGALYKGFGGSLPWVVMFRAMHFGGYDIAKEMIFSERKKGNFIEKYLVAYGVTMIAGFVSQPLSAVRDKQFRENRGLEKWKTGMGECVKKIYSEKGWRGFFGGMSRISVLSLSPALMLVLFDKLQYSWKGF